jgi:hypothetical protein
MFSWFPHGSTGCVRPFVRNRLRPVVFGRAEHANREADRLGDGFERLYAVICMR